MKKIIFACVHNAGRSQMAAAFLNHLADPSKAQAISAGTQPAERVHSEVVNTMLEVGIDLNGAKPQRLTPELAQGADLLITMGCGDQCPHIPGIKRDDWPLPDPRGLQANEVREIRDQIKKRVVDLLTSESLNSVPG